MALKHFVKTVARKTGVNLISFLLSSLDSPGEVTEEIQDIALVAMLEMMANLTMSAKDLATVLPKTPTKEDTNHLRFHLNSILNILSSAEDLIQVIEEKHKISLPKEEPRTVEELVQGIEQPEPQIGTIVSNEDLKLELERFFITK